MASFARPRRLLLASLTGFACATGCKGSPAEEPGDGGFTSSAGASQTDSDSSTSTTSQPTGTATSSATTDGTSETATTTASVTTASAGTTTAATTGTGTTTTVATTGSVCVDNDMAGLCFAGPYLYPATGAPADIVLADFDGDAVLDLATPLTDTGQISVRLGDGAGTFGAATTLTSEDQPVRLVAARFDTDATDDLAVVNSASNSVQIWLANGDGTFADPTTYVVGTGPTELAVADFTGDGRPDLVVANSGATGYHALVNSGTGTFAVGGPYSTQTTAPRGIALGSIALGSTVDVLYVGGSTFGRMNGLGDGTFDDGTIITGTHGVDLRRAEGFLLDGDDDADFVVADVGDDAVHVFQGATNANFMITTVAVGTDPVAFARADVDGDTLPDVVVTNNGSDDLTLLTGDGGIGLTAAGTLATGPQPSGVALGDLDGDADIDIVISLAGDDRVAVYLQQ